MKRWRGKEAGSGDVMRVGALGIVVTYAQFEIEFLLKQKGKQNHGNERSNVRTRGVK